MDPAFVLVHAAREKPIVLLLEQLDRMSCEALRDLRARDVRLGVHRRDRRAHDRAAGHLQAKHHVASARPGIPALPGAFGTPRSVASSSAAVAGTASGINVPRSPSGSHNANTTSPSNDVPTGVMRLNSAAPAPRASCASSPRSSAMFVATTHSVVCCGASAPIFGTVVYCASNLAPSRNSPFFPRAPAMMRPSADRTSPSAFTTA